MLQRIAIAAALGAGFISPGLASATGPLSPRVDDPTYYRDVLPIVQTKCSPCHADGGIAGLDLVDFDIANSFATVMASATQAGIMPPFPPDPDCASYRETEDRTLSPDQLETLARWAELEAPAGDPADAPAPPEPIPHPYGAPDLSLATDQPFVFDNQADDLYWCFRFDPGLDAPRDIVSATVTPDNENVVHHVIVFREEGGVDRKPIDLPGFECGGAPENAEFLIGWVPGARPTLFPDDYGMRLAEDDALIMQVHYHAYPGAKATDRTSLDLWFSDEPVSKTVKVVWTGSYDILVPPGLEQTTEGTCTLPADFEPVELLGVAPHMHQAGESFSSYIEHPDGSETCLVDIPKWDFDWQGAYSFLQPVTIEPGDVLHTDCRFDNDGSNTVTFGEGTSDEMCFQFNFVVEGGQELPQFCFDEPAQQAEPEGCGCRTGGGSGAEGLFCLVGLAAIRRRRRAESTRVAVQPAR